MTDEEKEQKRLEYSSPESIKQKYRIFWSMFLTKLTQELEEYGLTEEIITLLEFTSQETERLSQ